jgi:GrpB-like predicted nucleotidyltransferase (UPF0157 family)
MAFLRDDEAFATVLGPDAAAIDHVGATATAVEISRDLLTRAA